MHECSVLVIARHVRTSSEVKEMSAQIKGLKLMVPLQDSPVILLQCLQNISDGALLLMTQWVWSSLKASTNFWILSMVKTEN